VVPRIDAAAPQFAPSLTLTPRLRGRDTPALPRWPMISQGGLPLVQELGRWQRAESER
jgi:hypothetical protein